MPGRAFIRTTIAALIVFLSAAALHAESDGLKRHYSGEEGYSIEIPDGWTVSGAVSPGEDFRACGPADKGSGRSDSYMSVVVDRFAAKAELGDYWTRWKALIKAALPAVQEADDGILRVDNMPGRYLVYGRARNGTSMRGMLVCAVRDARGYAITYETTAEKYNGLREAFDRSARSFRFEEISAAVRPERYSNRKAGFSIAIPGDWRVRESAATDPLLEANAPLGTAKDLLGDRLMISIRKASAGMTLDACAGAHKKRMEDAGGSLVEDAPTKISGMEGRCVIFDMHSGASTVNNLSYFALRSDRVFVLTFLCDGDRYDRRRGTFDAIAQSLKVGESGEGFGEDALRHYNREQGYSIRIPEGWSPSAVIPSGVDFEATSPFNETAKRSDANMCVTVDRYRVEADLDEYYAASVALLKQAMLAYMEIDSGGMKVNGAPAKYIVYSSTAEGRPLKGVVVLLAKDSRAYSIAFNTSPEIYDSMEKTFEQSLQSFRFEDVVAVKRPERYSNRENGFAIAFPAGWDVSERRSERAGFVVLATSPLDNHKDTFKENIHVSVEKAPADPDLDRYVETMLDARGVPPGSRILESVPVWIAGHQGRRLTISMPFGACSAKVVDYVTIRDDRIYHVTCTGAVEGFDKHKDAFEAAARSFAFDNPFEKPAKK